MAGYTHLNLKNDVEDSAPGFQMSPDVEARFANDALGLEKCGMGYERLSPGVRMPFGHKQTQQEEVYVIASGSGRCKLDDEIVDVSQWDALRVQPEVMRAFEAGDDGMEIIAFGAPRTEEQDGDITPGWWAD